MKKLIASLTILATGAALASSVSSTATFGVLKIESSLAETVISVPWVEAGSSAKETIYVKDFVKTSNLNTGDRLLVYDPKMSSGAGGYKGWYLAAKGGAWTGVNSSYNNYNDISLSVGSDEDTLSRGQALFLIRTETSLNETDHNIYLYGQYKEQRGVNYSIPRAKGRTTLFAPVNTSGSALSLNDAKITWTGAEVGDQIKLQGSGALPLTYTYATITENAQEVTKWVRQKSNGTYDTAGAIKAGQGAWYITNEAGDSDTVTVTYTP